MKKQLLIITHNQFGYHIDGFNYCKYLNTMYEITYLCWDYKIQRIFLPNVKVIYISRGYSIIRRNFEFIKASIKETRGNYDLVFVQYFHGAILLRIFNPYKQFILDVRTGHVSPKKSERFLRDALLKFESLFFDHVTFISSGLAKKFWINSAKTHILPLGSDIISRTNKKFDQLNLIYVGTLSQRKIMDTIKGFHQFYKKYKDKVIITYTIIGSGYQNEEKDIINYIKSNGLDKIIKITGYIPHQQLEVYFDTHNIGVSYIPMTDFFDCQPPTKTYEYILSGMAVLATFTSENAKIINKDNGILIKDSPYAFYEGLCQIFNNRKTFQSVGIRETGADYTWKKIVHNNLHPYLKSILKIE